VKGSSCSLGLRIRALVIFALAFVAGSVLVFGAVSIGGTAFRLTRLPLQWKLSVLIASLIALALIDLAAIRMGRYCPLGWRRQTPKTLGQIHRVTTVLAFWGFDTGLTVTTFRVGAITWGALVITGLGLSPWWIGFGYGLAFIFPLFILILTRSCDASVGSANTLASKLNRQIKQRPLVQSGSAIGLLAVAIFLIRLIV
jgi:hypothetical protein